MSSSINNSTPTAIILGSSSIYRKSLLSTIYSNFICISPDINEYIITDGVNSHELSDPNILVLNISNSKCDKIVEILNEDENYKINDIEYIIITSDQIALYKNQIREKPIDRNQLNTWWNEYSNSEISAITGITVYNTKTKIRKSGTKYVTQKYKYIPQTVIDSLIENGEVFNCCGGFIVSNDIIQSYRNKILQLL